MANNDVMISYSRKDKAFVQRLDAALREAGLDPWVDWEDIPPTVDWMNRIQEGIAGANAFIFVITPDSISSKVCQAEFDYAVAHNKHMIPILHREVELPDASGKRASGNPLDRAYAALGFETEGEQVLKILSSHNWIFFRETDDFDTALKPLLEALRTDYDYIEEHTRLLMRAREWDQKKRPRSSLLVGDEVKTAEAWLAQGYQKKPPPTDLHLEYITASRQNQATWLRNLLIGVSIAFIIMLVLTIFAIFSFREADQQRKRAEEQTHLANIRALIANAQLAFANEDPELALSLALEANRDEEPLLEAQRVLFEIASAPAALRVFQGHQGRVWGLDISPDGNYALSGSGRLTVFEPISTDNTLRLWDINTGEEIRRFEGHTDTVFTTAFLPDGKRALSGSLDGNIILWDVESGEEIRRYTDHTDFVLALAVSADGKTFLSAGGKLATPEGDTTIRLWDVESGEIIQRYDDGQGALFGLAFSPDGKTFASSGGNLFTNADTVIRLWDVESGEVIRRFEGHTAFVFDVVFSPDGSMLLSGSGNPFTGAEDTTLRLWDVETGAELRRIEHGDTAAAVAFSPDGETFASAAFDGSVRLWNARTGERLLRFTGHDNVALRVVFSPDGNSLLSSSADSTLRLWSLESGAEISRVDGHTAGIYAVVLTQLESDSGGYVVVSADTAGNLLLSDTGSREILDRIKLDSAILCLAIQGNQVLSAGGAFGGGGDYSITLWDIEGKKFKQVQQYDPDSSAHTDSIRQVAFSPDGKTFASAAQDKTVILWDIASGEILHRFEGHGDIVYDVVFSPDGKYLFSASGDRTIMQWDAASGEAVYTFGGQAEGHQDAIWGLDISPDGQRLISGSLDAAVILWDIATRQPIGSPFTGHSTVVSRVKFSPDGKTALSSSWDNTLILWDVASGEILRRYSGHRDSVWSPVFSPDGKAVLSSSFDQTVRVWSVQTLDELLQWTCENRIVSRLDERERERFNITSTTPVCSDSGAS